MKIAFPLVTAFLLLLFVSCNNNNPDTDTSNAGGSTPSIPVLSYSIAAALPHDTANFTEGIEFYNNMLLESTGLKGKSRLVEYDPATDKVKKEVKLDPKFFGEGITVLHDTIYQLTWQEHVVNVYSAKDFKKIKELPLNTEGWGLTNDGKNLIASDGSSNLYFYEPSTFKLLHMQEVTENGTPAVNLNELEYINGFVYANQWQYNYILKIDPNNGHVVAKMDLTDLVNREKAKNPNADVLNGIAYDPTTKKVYVTGKNWSSIYQIQF